MTGFPPIRKKYIVLEAVDADDITDKVNTYIHDGYKPIGGVQVSCGEKYFQSMLYNGEICEDDSE